jgi:prepilin peptidase CpaA
MTAANWAVLVLGGIAVFEDLRRRQIPNWLTGAGVMAGFVCGAAKSGWDGLGMAAGGAAAGFLLFLIFYLLGGMGAGDIKLLSAFGALLGPSGTVIAGVLAAAAGALLAGAILLLKPRTRAIPYAPAIVAGAWLAMLGGK